MTFFVSKKHKERNPTFGIGRNLFWSLMLLDYFLLLSFARISQQSSAAKLQHNLFVLGFDQDCQQIKTKEAIVETVEPVENTQPANHEWTIWSMWFILVVSYPTQPGSEANGAQQIPQELRQSETTANADEDYDSFSPTKYSINSSNYQKTPKIPTLENSCPNVLSSARKVFVGFLGHRVPSRRPTGWQGPPSPSARWFSILFP